MCLDSLHAQAQKIGAEVLVADCSGSALPDDHGLRYPEVTWLKLPGASVFQARATAMSQARGQVVAITEDHCRVHLDWCEQIVALMERTLRLRRLVAQWRTALRIESLIGLASSS
jgi:hypothetical protein